MISEKIHPLHIQIQMQLASQLKICSGVPTISRFSEQNPSCWHQFRTILCSKSHKHSPKYHFVNLLKPTMSEETTNSILTRPRSIQRPSSSRRHEKILLLSLLQQHYAYFSLHWNEEYGRGNKSRRFVRPEGRHEVTNARKKNVISKQKS